MPVKVVESNLNVLQAAKIRIRNVFANGCKIYLSFSSGKDSLCMANLVYEMILSGELNPKQLTVTFIDEEGLYPSMVDAAYRWRRNFLSVGAKFLWFCLPFKQVSVIDHLSSSESWITWEPGKEDVWMRKPPDFAIMYSPYLHYAGEMNYQTFCSKAFSDGIQLVGLRTAETSAGFAKNHLLQKSSVAFGQRHLLHGNGAESVLCCSDSLCHNDVLHGSYAGCYRAAGSQRTRLRRWCGQHNSDENDHCAARNYPRQGCVCTGACIWQTRADL